MDLQTMITESRLIIGQPDSANSNFTDAQLTAWANEFQRRASVKLGTLPIKERTYDSPSTASPTITANAATVRIDRAKFNIQPDGRWEELKIVDIDELFAMNPNWENETAGKPTHLVKMGTFSYRLYPAPNTANASQTSAIKTYGLEMPTSLSSGTDVPDLPQNIQDLYPHWIAYKAFTRLGDKESAASELILAREGLKDMKSETVNFSKSRGWRWPGSDGPRAESLLP